MFARTRITCQCCGLTCKNVRDKNNLYQRVDKKRKRADRQNKNERACLLGPCSANFTKVGQCVRFGGPFVVRIHATSVSNFRKMVN